jgi:hypothetical protein
MSFKKTADVSVDDDPKGHRQDTAACVSLSKSTISKTKTEKPRPHCFAPVVGGGGVLAVSVSLSSASFREGVLFSGPAPRSAAEAGS